MRQREARHRSLRARQEAVGDVRKRDHRQALCFPEYEDRRPHCQVADNRIGSKAVQNRLKIFQLSRQRRDKKFTPQIPLFQRIATQVNELLDSQPDTGFVQLAKWQTSEAFGLQLAPNACTGVEGHFVAQVAKRMAEGNVRLQVRRKWPNGMQDLRQKLFPYGWPSLFKSWLK